MASTTANPAAGDTARGARNADLAGCRIGAEHNENASVAQDGAVPARLTVREIAARVVFLAGFTESITERDAVLQAALALVCTLARAVCDESDVRAADYETRDMAAGRLLGSFLNEQTRLVTGGALAGDGGHD